MTTNITTVAINLLIASRLEFRKTLADKIKTLVANCDAASDIEKEMKNRFFQLLDNCVEDPNCSHRNDFYLLADFYNRKINGNDSNITTAA